MKKTSRKDTVETPIVIKIKRIFCWLKHRHTIGETYKEGKVTWTACAICDYRIGSEYKGYVVIGEEENYFSRLRS